MGSTCSSVTMPMVDVTTKEEVPQIVPHSTNANITKKGSAWVFRTSVSERFYASVHAKYLSENVGKKVAYLFTTDGAGIGFAQGLHVLHGEDLQREAAVRGADAGDGSRFPRASAEDQVAQSRRCWRSADSSMRLRASRSSPTRSASPRRSVASRLRLRRMRRFPSLLGDAAVGLTFAAAFSCKDERPVAQEFVKMVQDQVQGPLPRSRLQPGLRDGAAHQARPEERQARR